jgi:hypothetical protein
MTPERRKCAVREASQRRPMLDNGSLDTCPQQRIGLLKPERYYEINTHFYGDVDPWDRLGAERISVATNKQQTFSVVTGGRTEQNGGNLRSSFALRDS